MAREEDAMTEVALRAEGSLKNPAEGRSHRATIFYKSYTKSGKFQREQVRP